MMQLMEHSMRTGRISGGVRMLTNLVRYIAFLGHLIVYNILSHIPPSGIYPFLFQHLIWFSLITYFRKSTQCSQSKNCRRLYHSALDSFFPHFCSFLISCKGYSFSEQELPAECSSEALGWKVLLFCLSVVWVEQQGRSSTEQGLGYNTHSPGSYGNANKPSTISNGCKEQYCVCLTND